MTYTNTLKINKTRFSELGLVNVDRGLWRFIVIEDNAVVGPYYATKIEALADLDRYAREYGLQA